ncbi:MAG: hypothetical protein Metus_0768 [Candidatus Methanosuratincola subterraneus]|uniref:Uncharacterized protein n=1 Tax=Methanosuratincola subterraneus TaxID=2593994 RepID=A0A3S3RM27_METS7|nr:MAG: hypothetical protein Metus_0768 [Candidatus Methanosuratincola subterraneus]
MICVNKVIVDPQGEESKILRFLNLA